MSFLYFQFHPILLPQIHTHLNHTHTQNAKGSIVSEETKQMFQTNGTLMQKLVILPCIGQQFRSTGWRIIRQRIINLHDIRVPLSSFLCRFYCLSPCPFPCCPSLSFLCRSTPFCFPWPCKSALLSPRCRSFPVLRESP